MALREERLRHPRPETCLIADGSRDGDNDGTVGEAMVLLRFFRRRQNLIFISKLFTLCFFVVLLFLLPTLLRKKRSSSNRLLVFTALLRRSSYLVRVFPILFGSSRYRGATSKQGRYQSRGSDISC